MKEIIVNELLGKSLRTSLVVQTQMRQAARVIVQCAFGLAVDGKALA